jgi:hypothetical protein
MSKLPNEPNQPNQPFGIFGKFVGGGDRQKQNDQLIVGVEERFRTIEKENWK